MCNNVSFFTTNRGIPVPAVTTKQMREIDRIAIEETGPNLFQMMENAGRNLALQAIEALGAEWQETTILVLAGTGGNGGCGICAARHLANRGAKVQLCLTDASNLREVPAFQRLVFQGTPGQELGVEELDGYSPDLIIDALIGYSLQSSPRGKALELIRWANTQAAPVLSLDVPSGVDSTTGEAPGESMRSDGTMTLALPKTGLLPAKTGELFLADIGIPAFVYKKLGVDYVPPFGSGFRVKLNPSVEEKVS